MKFLISAICLVFASHAQAQYKKTQVTKAPVSFASSVQHEAELTLGKLSVESYEDFSGDKNTAVTIYGAYHQNWKNNMQWGFEGGVLPVLEGDGGTESKFAALGTLTFNLDSNFRDSFFAIGGAGLYPAYDDGDREYDSAFAFFGGFGKRMEVWGKVNYKPYFRITKRGNEDVRIEIQALNFSIFY